MLLMGATRFRQREIVETATRYAKIVNLAKSINANDDAFYGDLKLAA
jgi:hypothetical protein